MWGVGYVWHGVSVSNRRKTTNVSSSIKIPFLKLLAPNNVLHGWNRTIFFNLKQAYEALKSTTRKTKERCFKKKAVKTSTMLTRNRLFYGSLRAIDYLVLSSLKKTNLDRISTLQNSYLVSNISDISHVAFYTVGIAMEKILLIQVFDTCVVHH